MSDKIKPGKCEHCGQTIQVYKYKVTPAMVYLLKDMARISREYINNGGTWPCCVDTADIDRPYGIKSQITKLRLHGLVDRDIENGKQVPRSWIITHKGWSFLKGEPVMSKVIVYNNKVIGYGTDTCTLSQVTGRADDYIAEPITPEQSKQLIDKENQ